MEWGQHREFLEGLRQDGERVPALENEPILSDELDAYYAAYTDLAPGRQIGFASGGIAFVDIAAYAQLFGVENAERFVSYIRALDVEFLAIQAERVEKES